MEGESGETNPITEETKQLALKHRGDAESRLNLKFSKYEPLSFSQHENHFIVKVSVGDAQSDSIRLIISRNKDQVNESSLLFCAKEN